MIHDVDDVDDVDGVDGDDGDGDVEMSEVMNSSHVIFLFVLRPATKLSFAMFLHVYTSHKKRKHLIHVLDPILTAPSAGSHAGLEQRAL